MRSNLRHTLVSLSAFLALACGGEKTPSGAAPTGAAPDVQPTGTIHTIMMVTDETGNYYSPKVIDASRGDVLRFTLKSGVHNVNFADSLNTIKEGLPKASDFLQLPGQEYDLPLSMRPGTYEFQCDPHSLLGMRGTVNIK